MRESDEVQHSAWSAAAQATGEEMIRGNIHTRRPDVRSSVGPDVGFLKPRTGSHSGRHAVSHEQRWCTCPGRLANTMGRYCAVMPFNTNRSLPRTSASMNGNCAKITSNEIVRNTTSSTTFSNATNCVQLSETAADFPTGITTSLCL